MRVRRSGNLFKSFKSKKPDNSVKGVLSSIKKKKKEKKRKKKKKKKKLSQNTKKKLK